MRIHSTIVMLLCLLALQTDAPDPTPLPDTPATPNRGYFVTYQGDNGYDKDDPPANADLDYFPDDLAQVVADALDEDAPFVNGEPNGYRAVCQALLFDLRQPCDVPTAVYDCKARGGGRDNDQGSLAV